MAARAERKLVVSQKYNLTPNMLRIVLSGDELASFPPEQESGYVKLMLSSVDNKLVTRSYTIRAFDAEKRELSLDFVLHGGNYSGAGDAASTWATNAVVGDTITVNGPGAKKMVNMSAEWFFLAGDMTALPAIAVNLERLPKDAKGYAFIEVLSEADKQMIDVPVGIDVQWVINPHPDQPNSVLADAVKSASWLSGVVNVWLASEFETMRVLRRYFKGERGVTRDQIYASSYWKMGEADEGNKAAKKQDTEADL